MEISVEEIDGGVRKVVLTGRLDVQGTLAIDAKFAALVATRGGAVIVDLSGVSFLASIGIRTLLQSAKAVSQRGGKMVIAGAQAMVEDVLRTSGVVHVIPLYPDLATACAALATVASV
jgi:anti-anti-sigma factor